MIFAASAKSGTIFALSSGSLSGVVTEMVTGVQTGDLDEAVKAGTLAGSEGFKWGAISGAISGGVSEAVALHGATLNGLTMNEAAQIQRESGYPLDVIKEFKSMEQYNICKEAGLTPNMINNQLALTRSIDPNYINTENGLTNLELMQNGNAPFDPIGQRYQLHHIGQRNDSTLAVLTQAEHMSNGNNAIWHELGNGESQIDRQMFAEIREQFWIAYASNVS